MAEMTKRKGVDLSKVKTSQLILKDENQTEFDRQQEAWFENNCQGKIEDY